MHKHILFISQADCEPPHFSLGGEYTLPEKMPGARVLREGGNGLVLEVTVQVTMSAGFIPASILATLTSVFSSSGPSVCCQEDCVPLARGVDHA